jgi:hypothetical protein
MRAGSIDMACVHVPGNSSLARIRNSNVNVERSEKVGTSLVVPHAHLREEPLASRLFNPSAIASGCLHLAKN